jgi:hypothetical protein
MYGGTSEGVNIVLYDNHELCAEIWVNNRMFKDTLIDIHTERDLGTVSFVTTLNNLWKEHPEWKSPPWKESMRNLPSRNQHS